LRLTGTASQDESSKSDAKKSKATTEEIVSGPDNGLLNMGDDDEKSYDYSLFKERDAAPSVLAHAPYFPCEKKPCWWIVMASEKRGVVVRDPVKVHGISTSKVIKIAFPVPPHAGVYSYTVFIKCDSYIGTDLKKEFKVRTR
jgi:translocation protein SEC63